MHIHFNYLPHSEELIQCSTSPYCDLSLQMKVLNAQSLVPLLRLYAMANRDMKWNRY